MASPTEPHDTDSMSWVPDTGATVTVPSASMVVPSPSEASPSAPVVVPMVTSAVTRTV